ncbi:MAG: DUF3108 domain-containing protein, partial [Campylobacteraceae bacterium]|nr:DUF3108 domain-containing protein [Campylobacteraceae bacterium]
EQYNNIECFYFEGIGKSNSLFDLFFKVNDEYISYVNFTSLSPVHFIRDVNEGGYIIKQNYLFNAKKNEVLAEDSIYQIPKQTQDMLSGYYFTRALLNLQNVS